MKSLEQRIRDKARDDLIRELDRQTVEGVPQPRPGMKRPLAPRIVGVTYVDPWGRTHRWGA